MARTKIVNGRIVTQTQEEELHRDAEEAEWAAGKDARDLADAEKAIKGDVDMPTLEDKVDAILEGGQKLLDIKDKVARVKTKHGRG